MAIASLRFTRVKKNVCIYIYLYVYVYIYIFIYYYNINICMYSHVLHLLMFIIYEKSIHVFV